MRTAVSGSRAERREDLSTAAVTAEVTCMYMIRTGRGGISKQQHSDTLTESKLMGIMNYFLYFIVQIGLRD